MSCPLRKRCSYRDDLSFFQAVAVELRRARAEDRPRPDDDVELETAIRQVVSDAVDRGRRHRHLCSFRNRSDPTSSIIDDEFAKRLTTNPHPNVQIELLRRLLASEVKSMSRRNVVAERKFSEMLERAMKAYNNRSLTAAEVIAELVELAKEMKTENERGATLGLRDDELAFYDAVCQNDSAVMELGDEVLKQHRAGAGRCRPSQRHSGLGQEGTSPGVASSAIRRLLTKYRYPPDKQEAAIALVMDQAERLAGEAAA